MKRLSNGVWVLIADGAHARIFRNEGDAVHPKLVAVRTYDQDNPPTHELGSERPGRINDSLGRRSAMETPDLHRLAEDKFIVRLAADMDKDLSQGNYDRAIIVAPPIALGTLRKAISPAVAKSIVFELHKDLTKHTVADIAKIIVAALEQPESPS